MGKYEGLEGEDGMKKKRILIPHVGEPVAPDSVEMTAETIDFINAVNAKRKAAGREHKGTVCLVCCGCFEVLCDDGTLAFFNPTRGVANARVFTNSLESDIVARKLGWMATEEGNHRCPACYAKYLKLHEAEMENERVGCHIPACMVRQAAR